MLLAAIFISAILGQAAPVEKTPAQTAPTQTKTTPKQTHPASGASGATSGNTARTPGVAHKPPAVPPPFGVSDVIALLNAKVSEGIVVDTIRKQNVKISLTPNDLVALGTAGASARIMHELDPSLGGDTPDPVPAAGPVVHEAHAVNIPDLNDPDSPHTAGVYVYTEENNGRRKMVKLEKTVPQTSRSKMAGFLGYAMYAFVPKPNAMIRVSDHQPVFYMYAPPSGEMDMVVDNPGQLQLIKMDPQSIYDVEGRRLLYGKAAHIFSTPIAGTDPKAIWFFKSETKGPGYFRIVPEKQLVPGEYCFFYFQGGLGGGKGTQGNVMLLDFGVD